MFLNQSLFIVGVHLSGAVVASCIQPSQPLITFAIAVMLGRERLDWRRLTGLFSAVLGAVWVILGNAFFLESANLLLQNMFGDLCLITNCVAMAFCYIVMKDLSRTYPSVVVISWIYVFAAMYLVRPNNRPTDPQRVCVRFRVLAGRGSDINPPRPPPSLLQVMLSPFMHSSLILPMSTIPLLLYLIFVCSFASYTVIAFANKQLASSQVSAFTCLQPIVGSLAAVFLLKENPSARTVAGGGLITLGLLIAVAERRRPKLAACSVIIQ